MFTDYEVKSKINIMVNAQKVFDKEYPTDGICLGEYDVEEGQNIVVNKGKTRNEITKISFHYKHLKGSLVIKDFPNLEEIDLWGNKLTSLTLISCPKVKFLDCRDNNLTQLPTGINTEQLIVLLVNNNQIKLNLSLFSEKFNELNFINLRRLNISNNEFYGLFKLTNFNNLEILDFSRNKITELEVSNCQKLTGLDCSDNQLTKLSLPASLTYLNLRDNNFPAQDLSLFSQLVNLKALDISDWCNPKNINIHNHFTGSFEPLKNLSKLREINIRGTQINETDTRLECLSDSLEKIFCHHHQIHELEEHKKEDETKEEIYYDYRLWRKIWKKDQQIALLQKEQTLFSDQKSKIDYLQERINELNDLNKEQIEKIFNSLSRLLPEKELLGELIKTHLEFIKYKNQGTNDSDYSKRKRKYERNLGNTKDELGERLTDEQMNSVETILNDFEKLVEQNLELEEKLNKKSHLIAGHKQMTQQIKSPESDRIVEIEEEVQEQQMVQYKRQRSHSVTEIIANLKGQIEVYKELVIVSHAPIIINNTNSNTNAINDNSATYHNSKHNEFLQNQFDQDQRSHQEFPPKGSQS